MSIFSPYRKAPVSEEPVAAVALPNRLDRAFYNMEVEFSFSDGGRFTVSFEHDAIPPEFEAGGAHVVSHGPPSRSAEDYLQSYVRTAHENGFFTFAHKGELQVVPWHRFTGAVTRTTATKKVNITWDWKRDR